MERLLGEGGNLPFLHERVFVLMMTGLRGKCKSFGGIKTRISQINAEKNLR